MGAPTLLVGLGGSGSDVVQAVYRKATDKQKEQISFVIFDTDVNELRGIEDEMPLIRTVQVSTRLTVGEYLDVDQYARDNWFPVNHILGGKSLTEGAGQVRAISRLALNTAIQQGKLAPLDGAIESLYKLSGQKTQQSPRVIVTGSLCGGTGSGLILPVCLYIRNFMTTKLQQSSAIIRGFFLLPEVFYGVINTQSERNNLRSNAYAALREIDAFMMKADGSLPANYDLHFMAPRAGAAGQEEYSGKPMDFCFLFDGQNLNGQKLNSFAEYKAHAANCIYGMAIAPTSKRSNSSEDNVIREIAYAGGRNRFAGAGTSMLIYPTSDVKKYLSLNWTRDSVTGEWLEIDSRYKEQRAAAAEMRKKGVSAPEIDRRAHYINVVDEGVKQHKAFESAVRRECYEYDATGYTEKEPAWEQYMASLETYVKDQIDARREQIAEVIDEANAASSIAQDPQLGKGTGSDSAINDAYESWLEKLLSYKNATRQHAEDLARNIVYTLFEDKKDYSNTDSKFRLEYWMHGNEIKEQFNHPNAVRYYLCQILARLNAAAAEERIKLHNDEDIWNGIYTTAFDVKGTEEEEDDPQGFYEASHFMDHGLKRILHRKDIAGGRQQINDAFNDFMAATDEYWQSYIFTEVYSAGVGCVSGLCSAYESFYDILDRNVQKIGSEIRELEEKYTEKEGEAVRYVCADADCLRGISKEAVNSVSSIETPSEMNRRIYKAMKAYAFAEKKPEDEQYFTNVFTETIQDFLGSQIESQYGSLVNMDVITALKKEAYYRDPKENFSSRDQELYAEKAIESTEILAKPFIESPLGKEPRVIPACAYNPGLSETEEAGRKEFVARNLSSRGGVADDSIDRNMILFYQAVYDIRANDLSKFAPPKHAQTYNRIGGEYFTAYHNLISQINPNTDKSQVITPHIDKWWHIISKLPELDEETQKETEHEIFASLFWALLGKYIRYGKDSGDNYKYTAEAYRLGMKSKADSEIAENLIVTNGTTCDHLYEVLDVFTNFPQLGKHVRDAAENCIARDLYTKTSLDDSQMMREIRGFTLDESFDGYDIGLDRCRSIFEIPILMKASVPTEEYYEPFMTGLLETILDEVVNTVKRFCTKKDSIDRSCEIIRNQYALMTDNIARYEKKESVLTDSLFDTITDIICARLESFSMHMDALEINRQADEARKAGNPARKAAGRASGAGISED